MITKVSTKDMSRGEWLDARKKSIGGSDAASVLGLNPYSSAYALWCEKTGKITPEDISDKEAVRLGNDLEQYVAERFTDATGKKVRRDNYIIYNDRYPFAHANVDRMVVGEKAGLECKTTSSWDILSKCRAGEYPQQWYVQMVHYMMLTGADRWYLGVLAFGHGFFWFTIERSEDEIQALSDAERDFWDNVQNNTPPFADGTEATLSAIKTIFPESTAGYSIDLTGVGAHLDMYSALGRQIDELETARNEHAAAIQSYMQDAEKGAYGSYSVSWKTQTRKTFDKKSYEAANGPIGSAYYRESTSRPFRVTAK